MPNNWVNPKKQQQEQVQRDNAQIKRERDRQRQIQIGKRQGWVNPNLYTPQEKRDRWLESQGLLNYQRRQTQGGIDARLVPSGGNADRPQNFVQGTDPVTGKPVISQQVKTNANSPYAPMVFAKPEQVQQGQAGWQDLSSTDRQTILKDPKFYQGNQITKYTPAIQQEILADPNFDWKQLPAWQRVYYSLSSNPAAMGAVQGLAMSAGNPGGALLGAPLGWSASVVGYDPNKEFYKQGDNKFTFDKNQAAEFARGAFGLLNWGAEQVEKGVGVLVKSAAILTDNDPNFDPNKRNLDIRFNENFNPIPGKNFDPNFLTGSTWNAGASTLEAIAPAVSETGWLETSRNLKDKISSGNLTVRDFIRFFPGVATIDMLINPNEYKGEEAILGAATPVAVQQNLYERLQEAENRIKAGEDYRTVATEMQNGIKAQISDMVGQGIADPLNYAGLAETVVGKVASDITGDKIAAEAFRQSAMSESPGVMNAKDRIKNIVNTPGEAIKIDPNYKVQELGSISKWMAGLNSQGQIKAGGFTNQGLLDYKPPKKNVFGFIEYLANQTPESRARVGQDLLISNVGRIMASYFNGTDVEGFANWWNAFSKGDMTQAADLSRAMANSPEFYTVLPAAANFDMDAAVAKWTASADARDAVTRVADALGENPMSMIEDMAKRGTAEQDFTRLKERLAQSDTPEARAILAEIDNGRFTPEILQDTIKLFSNGDVPYHPGQWMAQTLGDIQKHYDTWAVDHFKLDTEAKKTLFRMSAVLKSAQSVLLLGANPGYMISNVLPTMVTRAMSGVWGYMTPTAIDTFLTRMGFSPEAGLMPNRLDEGVGPGGLVDQTRVQGDAIREATRGNGTLTKIEDAIGKVGRNMPFNKLSRLLEGYEGTQAYLIGMKKAWGESWRRGKGFRELPTGLVNELQRVAGPRAADILYSAIEARMNKTEVQNIVSSATGNIQSRTLINEAATRLNIPASKAAAMMEQAGVFDALDASLKNAKTEAQINRAFERAAETTKRQLDQQTARDAVANIEHVANKLQTEGVKAVTDIILDTEDAGIEKWLQHYQRMGEVADAMENIDNPQTRSNLWSLKYAESSAEFRRHNAHKGSVYLGVLKALGEDTNPNGRALLANLASTDAALDTAYRTMRQLRDEHFSKWNGDWENPRRQVERTNVERQIEQAWNRATKTEIENSRKFGELLGNQYEATFGVEAGEAARQAWEQITAFRKEMTDRRDAFRRSLEGLPAAERQAVSKKFWGETYKYMIAEMQRIKTEAITQLDRIANNRRNGGDMTGSLSPNDPNAPTQPPAGMTPDEYTRLRQQAEERYAAQQAKIDAVWEVANQYGFTRENTSGTIHLLSALKKEEYGGDPSFTGDIKAATERWTPDEIDAILEKRRQVKDTNNQERIASRNMEYQAALQRAAQDASKRAITENTPLIEAVRRHGGIDWSYVEQVTGEKKPPINQRSIFSKTGKNRWGLDEMARILADDGYPIDLNSIDDPGGIQQTVDLIQRAYRGEQILPMGSPRGEALLDASLARAEADYIDNLMMQDEFKPEQWETDVLDAVESMDFTRLSTLIEQLPPDIGDQPYSNVTGETYNEFISRTWDETEARMKEQEQAALIADNTARSERAMQDIQTEAQTGFTRAQFRESLTEVFGLTDDMADAVMDITDARANAYGDVNEWYRTRIADVQKAGEIDLAQEAFHGSPYKFDKFTLDAMGTGEGAQAYGWGLYFAGDKAVAEYYREVLSNDKVTYKGLESNQLSSLSDYPNYAANEVMAGLLRYPKDTIETVIKRVANQNADLREKILALNPNDFKRESGQLYKVDIPDDGYLLWDKPFKEQSLAVRDFILREFDFDWGRSWNNDTTGGRLHEMLSDKFQNPKSLSLAMKESGISGIKYLDGSSRAAGEGNYNYVVFDDNAINILETYYQSNNTEGVRNPKAGVRFMEDGRAIIRAWEGKADVSSIAHELGHIFRRDLQGGDLRIIEQWAEVKDGNWTRAAEEKFARGFEKYLADGSAPTPKLRRVFEQFKVWMTGIYRAITGSPIDIDLTPQVKEVFDRLLTGQEQPRSINVDEQLFQMGYDPKAYYLDPQGNIKRRGELKIGVDRAQVAAETDAILSSGMIEKLKQLKKTGRTGEGVDPTVTPRRGQPHELSYGEFKANILQEQKARAEAMLDRLAKVEAGDLPQDNVPDLMRSTLKKVRDDGGVMRYKSTYLTLDEVRTKYIELRDRNTISYEMYGDVKERWMQSVERALTEDTPVPDDVKQAYYAMKKTSGERMQGAGTSELFQTDTPPSISGYNVSEELIKSLQEATKGVEVNAYLSEKDGVITLHDIVVPKDARNQGVGTKFMEALTKYADENNKTIVLTAAGDFGGSKSGQQRFYKRQGFVKNKDYQYRENMIRRPNDWLFQDADPRMPLGAYDESAGWFPQSQAMDEVWAQEFQPLLDGMRNVAVENLNNPTMTGMYSQLSPDAQKQLNNYLKGVQSDMASTKMAAQRWGQDRRDFAMLNYNSRTGFDQWLDIAFPYQFFYTRSMMTWASRVIDKPAILSNYARIRKQQDRYENNLPERLRGKMRIEAPYLPDWMGDALYIDPLSVLFTPHNFLRPFEQMAKDQNMQVVEAERILQEWSADGQIPEDQIIEAAKNRSGTVWERALAEAKIRREAEISNPMDFVSATFGPAWYLTTAAKLLGTGKDGAETLTELPITRTARAVDTVTQNTWAEPIGNLIGLLAKPEEKFREAKGIPEFGEYGDYYVDRQLANMVAEGLITSEDAQIAMIERKGDLFDQARERVKMELAMRVPLMGATYAGLNSDNFFSGLGNFIKALPPSLFGAGLLPEGELKYRGLKQEWNDAWKLRDAGDQQAITRFFDEHPEYEAYLAKGKEPEERLRSFLVGQIWDGYMGLGTTDRKTATAELGDEFKQSFLDSETRSYDTISIETLTQWAQMVNKKVPNTPQTLPAIQNPRTVDYLPQQITKVTDQYFEQRNRLYPQYYELQSQYYNLPKSERRAFLIANPQLKDYWDWNRQWKARYPELQPVFNGQVFKRVDTETWNPLLVQYVADYAYSGTPLGPGAYKALEQIWINEGQPRGDFESWLKNDVAPSFLYGQ